MKLKLNTFNKIIGTEFRVNNIVKLYANIAVWFVETAKENINEGNFRKWIEDSGIYKYKTQNKIQRFKMLRSVILNKFKLIKVNEKNEYELNCKINEIKNYILNALTKTDIQFKEKHNETCIAFKAMLDFMIGYPNLNDAKRIFHAFIVYTESDDFLQLYNCDIIGKIVDYNVAKNNGYQIISQISNGKIFRKPNEYLKEVCKKIINNKDNFLISIEEFEKVKRCYLTNFCSPKEVNEFVKNNTYDEIAKTIIRKSMKRNFNHEFFDLFNRLLYSLDICQSTGIKVEKYLNNLVKKENGKYFILNDVFKPTWPYTLLEVNNALMKINNNNYDFISEDTHLSQVPKADISEYFVNIKFCYLKKIKPKYAKEYINTILDEKLYPISHAPSRRSDMIYYENNVLWSIETTIHNTVRKVINNECYGSIQHILRSEKMNENNVLVLVSKLNSQEDLDKINRWIMNSAIPEFNKKHKKFTLETYNFEQFSKLS